MWRSVPQVGTPLFCTTIPPAAEADAADAAAAASGGGGGGGVALAFGVERLMTEVSVRVMWRPVVCPVAQARRHATVAPPPLGSR